ncbi:MAG: ribose 5-phosphate isomerase A [Candidatus Diapherotrites archaeon]|nr:ribose 5-phosphate isomerase A [Candidatus Diapherotrites archaeon]
MVLKEETIEAIAARYIKHGAVLAFGTSHHSEVFLKKIAMRIEEEKMKIKVIPNSHRIASVLHDLKIPTVSLNDVEIDLAFEFVSQVDRDFNFVKKDSMSLVRDKMIAQSAAELIVITEKENFAERINGVIPCEIVPFGYKRTLLQLQKLGEVKLREKGGKEFRTETNNLIADVAVDEIYDLNEIEFQAKEVPGVIETGLFIGYADRIILHNHGMEVKSRMDFEKQEKIPAK